MATGPMPRLAIPTKASCSSGKVLEPCAAIPPRWAPQPGSDNGCIDRSTAGLASARRSPVGPQARSHRTLRKNSWAGAREEHRPEPPPRWPAGKRCPTRENPSSKPKCLVPCYPLSPEDLGIPLAKSPSRWHHVNRHCGETASGWNPIHPGPVERHYGLLRAKNFSRKRAFTPGSRLRRLISPEIVPDQVTHAGRRDQHHQLQGFRLLIVFG